MTSDFAGFYKLKESNQCKVTFRDKKNGKFIGVRKVGKHLAK